MSRPVTRPELYVGSAVAGVSGAVLVSLVRMWLTDAGVTAGQWLQFAGVFCGVVATMGATTMLQHLQEARKRKRESEDMLAALAAFRVSVEDLGDEPYKADQLLSAASHIARVQPRLVEHRYRVQEAIEILLALWASVEQPLRHEAALKHLYSADYESSKPLDTIAGDLLSWVDRTSEAVRQNSIPDGDWRNIWLPASIRVWKGVTKE